MPPDFLEGRSLSHGSLPVWIGDDVHNPQKLVRFRHDQYAMYNAFPEPAINLACQRQFDFVHSLRYSLQLPIALATEARNFWSCFGFTTSLLSLLIPSPGRSASTFDSF